MSLVRLSGGGMNISKFMELQVQHAEFRIEDAPGGVHIDPALKLEITAFLTSIEASQDGRLRCNEMKWEDDRKPWKNGLI